MATANSLYPPQKIAGLAPFNQGEKLVSESSLDDIQLQKRESYDCTHCMRDGAPLFCFGCGYFMANGRTAKPCPSHPKVIFYTDFKACPKCKGNTLSELD